MRVTNGDFTDIYKCFEEIICSKDAKNMGKVSGTIVYNLVKSMNEMKPFYKELGIRETSLKEAYNASVASLGEDQKDQIKTLKNQLSADIKELFDNQTIEINPYQMPLEICEQLQAVLTGPSTLALFTYLILEPKK